MNISKVIAPQTPLIEVVRLNLSTQTNILLRQFDRINAADRLIVSEGVHKARTTSRRCTSLLKATKPWMDKRWNTLWLKKAQVFLQALGPVRDLDIIIAFISGDEEISQDLKETLKGSLEKERIEKFHTLQETIETHQIDKQFFEEQQRLSQPEILMEMMPLPLSERGKVRLFTLGDCLPAILFSAAAQLTVFRQVIPGPDDIHRTELEGTADAVYHRLRLAVKDFRNLLLLFVRPDGSDPFMQQIQRLQQDLGDWHDLLLLQRFMLSTSRLQQKEVVHQMQMDIASRMDNLKKSFLEQWQPLSAEYFTRHITDCLLACYRQKEQSNCACSGCGGQPDVSNQA